MEVYDRFEIPLRNAGFSGDNDDLLEQWHDSIEYASKYLSPSSTEYHHCWYKIFNSTMSRNWELSLLLICLLFTLPVSNAIVERLISLMKRLKTALRSLLGNDLLNATIRICNGPSPENFDPTSALSKFMETKDRRTKQSKRMAYKARVKNARVDTLMDMLDSKDDTDNEDDHGDAVDSDDEEIDTTFEDAVEYE